MTTEAIKVPPIDRNTRFRITGIERVDLTWPAEERTYRVCPLECSGVTIHNNNRILIPKLIWRAEYAGAFFHARGVRLTVQVTLLLKEETIDARLAACFPDLLSVSAQDVEDKVTFRLGATLPQPVYAVDMIFGDAPIDLNGKPRDVGPLSKGGPHCYYVLLGDRKDDPVKLA